jgi:8-oxo-dGTP pyrophosphatase MutT (NUDIX family)
MLMNKNFNESSKKLGASSAVAAMIVLDDGRFLLQLRDAKPEIYYPAHWGFFGGAVDDGETPEQALLRELEEELKFVPQSFSRFTNFDFDFSFSGCGVLYRTYYTVPISTAHLDELVLGEGAGMNAFTPEFILSEIPVVPYDSFALWLYINQQRIVPGNKRC